MGHTPKEYLARFPVTLTGHLAAGPGVAPTFAGDAAARAASRTMVGADLSGLPSSLRAPRRLAAVDSTTAQGCTTLSGPLVWCLDPDSTPDDERSGFGDFRSQWSAASCGQAAPLRAPLPCSTSLRRQRRRGHRHTYSRCVFGLGGMRLQSALRRIESSLVARLQPPETRAARMRGTRRSARARLLVPPGEVRPAAPDERRVRNDQSPAQGTMSRVSTSLAARVVPPLFAPHCCETTPRQGRRADHLAAGGGTRQRPRILVPTPAPTPTSFDALGPRRPDRPIRRDCGYGEGLRAAL